MVINALLALIKQCGIQLLEIVRLVKGESYLLQVLVFAQNRKDFGIRLIVSSAWFLNSSISLYLNAFSALIGKYMTHQLQNVLIAHNKILILTVANVLPALQLLSTTPRQKLVKIVHWGRASIRIKKSANARITISGMTMPVSHALFPTISTSLRSNVLLVQKERSMIYSWENVLAVQQKILFMMDRNAWVVARMSTIIQHQRDA